MAAGWWAVGAGVKQMMSGITPKTSERHQRVFAASKSRDYVSPHVFKLSWDQTPKQLRSLIGSYLLGSWSIVCYFCVLRWGRVLQHPWCCPVYDTTSSPIFRVQPIPFCEINGDLGRWTEMPIFGFMVDKCKRLGLLLLKYMYISVHLVFYFTKDILNSSRRNLWSRLAPGITSWRATRR